jgi:predicted nucleic acid-binding protein
VLFDTDVLVWVFRGNSKAAKALEAAEERRLSVVSYMELLQGARDKDEARKIKVFLADFGFEVMPLTENIGHRASIYMEEYGLKVAMCVGDALIAATAVEAELQLLSGNQKHYKVINELDLEVFKP